MAIMSRAFLASSLALLSCCLSGVPGVTAATRLDQLRQALASNTGAAANCSDVSLSRPEWYVYYPTLTTVNASTGGTTGDVQFQAFNLMTGQSSNCSAHNIDLEPGTAEAQSVWHKCSTPETVFQFKLSTLEMRLNSTWTCGDLPQYVGIGFLFPTRQASGMGVDLGTGIDEPS
jgi:hypothetical protein